MNPGPEPPAGAGGELPDAVRLAHADVERDPDGAEARGAALMAASAGAIVDGVEGGARPYVLRRASEVLDAWGGVHGDGRLRALEALDGSAARATQRVLTELRALFVLDVAEQRRTPLEIVRTLRREPSEVLAALGVPSIVRDAFEERALPDDPYGLAPRTLADLGDDELGAMQLAWGVGKATLVRARAARSRGAQDGDNRVENLSTAPRHGGPLRSVLGTAVTTGRRVIDELRTRVHERPERDR
jgi:hypothetical protein